MADDAYVCSHTRPIEIVSHLVAHDLDLLADLANGQLFHLELQTRNDPSIGRRLLEYRLLIEDALHREPEQMVLYVGWEPLRMPNALDRRNLHFEYSLVDIRDLDPKDLASSDRMEDRILSILFGRADAKPAAIAIVRATPLKAATNERRRRTEWIMLTNEFALSCMRVLQAKG